jgi:hypothetical protein
MHFANLNFRDGYGVGEIPTERKTQIIDFILPLKESKLMGWDDAKRIIASAVTAGAFPELYLTTKGQAAVLSDKVLNEIAAEAARAHAICKPNFRSMLEPNLTDGERLAILLEEVGEVARCMNDKEPPERYAEELVQVAAMSASWRQTINV